MELWQFIRRHMLTHAQQTVCEKDAKITFEEMAIFSEIFAQKLQGIKCCAILCRSEMAAAMGLLSCFAAGVTAVPLSLRYGEKHCKTILDTISPDAVITAIRPALIMCTSGTTGVPKGAMLSERGIVTNVKDIAEYFTMDTTDTILIARPLYHCAVLSGEFLAALVKGTRI